MYKHIGIIYDIKHPLLECIEQRLIDNNIKITFIHWNDIFYNYLSNQNLFINFDVLYLDRMGESTYGYSTSLEFLKIIKNEVKIKIINDPKHYYVARNKALMYKELINKNILIPPTYLIASINQLYKKLNTESWEIFIIKPILGCCCEDIFILKKGDEIPTKIEDILKRDGLIIIQKFIMNLERYIWRIDIVNNKIIQCNQRYSYNSLTKPPLCNGTLGGDIKIWSPENIPIDIKELALKAYKSLRLEVAGIDILVSEDKKNYILEINPEPDITLSYTDLPYAIADYLIEKIKN